ncbi:MAG: hypothetical protein HQL84_16615 [Magnetococcales bacterium]|nr:hypothetical protein [Magnetococcales bacterium]MBF0151644.1 hypothetical protein [Magnetococcales bacterium]MBF0174798.1 hypothetical protein [Magnetococcales bacterium]MBF0346057.1 hypothetical protein [Magnetococcales bacterium]MBF0632639.1 hypothetical protein [Magnetococcales bacterium]
MPDSSNRLPPSKVVARLHLVAKLGLWAGISSGLLFTAILFYLDHDPGGNYASMFNSLMMTRKQLEPALMTSGTILLAMTGLVTWMIALYSTYRIAGPLHQFTQTLIRQIKNGPCSVGQLTGTGELKNEHLRLAGAANRLQFHYDSLSERVDSALVLLNSGKPDLGDEFKHHMQKFKELDELVKL